MAITPTTSPKKVTAPPTRYEQHFYVSRGASCGFIAVSSIVVTVTLRALESIYRMPTRNLLCDGRFCYGVSTIADASLAIMLIGTIAAGIGLGIQGSKLLATSFISSSANGMAEWKNFGLPAKSSINSKTPTISLRKALV